MRILLSAYDCDPCMGSEAGVGWNWAVALGRKHEVVVLTREAHRASIEAHSRGLPQGLSFTYFDNPSRIRQLTNWRVRPYLDYLAWQRDVVQTAEQLNRERRFDVVQHITWGSWGLASHLHRVGIPFVFGPVGGGDSTPRQLRKSLDIQSRIWEETRDLGNLARLAMPSLRECLDRSRLILCRTEGTRAYIPKRLRAKTRIHREIGVDSSRIISHAPTGTRDGRLRVLFVGRFLALKGIHLALRAVGALHRSHPNAVTFDLVGGMRENKYKRELRALIVREGLQDVATIHDWLPHDRVQEMYRNYDVFLFPSFRDSGGTAVLESLTAGLPVICLDLGGPPNMLGGKGGIVIPAHSQTEAEVVMGLTQALERLHNSPPFLQRLKQEARDRAAEVTWEKTVDSAYRLVEEVLDLEPA